jgi:cation:H+ antiporter
VETTMGFWPALGLMLVSFAILAKCADWLVEGAIGISQRLHMPPILIGIVVVSLGTTAPELAVSVQAALRGEAAMALGNAVGSVIYDDGLALALAALLAPAPILINRTVLRSSAIFLIIVDIIGYALCLDGTLSRGEGGVLVLGFVGYLVYSYLEQKRGKGEGQELPEEVTEEAQRSWGKILLFFAGGLVGVVFSSEWIVESASVVGLELGVPIEIVALAAVALGTSVPEVATCIIAARKGQGGLAVGNILGADILNICWIAGASAVVNPLVVQKDVINFMFPSMLVIVFSMLAMMRMGHRLVRWNGLVLLALLVVYLALLFVVSPGSLPEM